MDDQYQRILLTDDGSPLARAAIPYAAAMARATDAKVLVVRVSKAAGLSPDELDDDDWDGYFDEKVVTHAAAEPLEAVPHLSEVVEDLKARGVRAAGSLVLRGDAAEALVEALDELEVGLLVMSSQGETGIRPAVLGSVADHLVRHARETPVLLCPSTEAAATAEDADVTIRRILLPLDGSEVSEVAVTHAAFLARAAGAELLLLRATASEADLLAASMPTGTPPVASISVEAAQAAVGAERTVARESLERVAADLRARGVGSVSVEVVAGDAADAILAATERLDIDVVVMATHGRSGLGRLLLGSVADAVSRHSQSAAVLLVRPHED
ncbi:MAG: universal stress protein [Dehalococcoidia bacterium]|nr:universal stress protein [Dehalococcoidia bacterium]